MISGLYWKTPFRTRGWVLGKDMATMEAVQWWKVLPDEQWAPITECVTVCVDWTTLAMGSQKGILLLGEDEPSDHLWKNLSTCSTWDSSRVHRTMPGNFKFTVPNGHGSGRGQSLLDASSADKPANWADSQSEEWKEGSKRGNFASYFIHLFYRKVHKVTHRPSIHS